LFWNKKSNILYPAGTDDPDHQDKTACAEIAVLFPVNFYRGKWKGFTSSQTCVAKVLIYYHLTVILFRIKIT